MLPWLKMQCFDERIAFSEVVKIVEWAGSDSVVAKRAAADGELPGKEREYGVY